MNQKSDKGASKVFLWIPVAFWMLVIFLFSAQPATESASLSTEILQVLQGIMKRVLPGLVFEGAWFHLLIRKGAHFFVYAVLGGLIVNALWRKDQSFKRTCVMALVISVLYATSDEWHQTYVPGRAGQVADVLLDGLGSLGGILATSWVKR